MARASAWLALVDIFTTRSCLDSRESLAPFEHLSQDFAAFQLPFKNLFWTRIGEEERRQRTACEKGTSWFLRPTRNADDADPTEPGVDRLPPVSIAWQKR
jgi:hypothetical protein